MGKGKSSFQSLEVVQNCLDKTSLGISIVVALMDLPVSLSIILLRKDDISSFMKWCLIVTV